MMNVFVRILNHRTYPLAVAAVLGGLIFALSANGISTLDIVIVSGAAVVAFVGWQILHESGQKDENSAKHIQDKIQQSDRPTLIEFYSEYCVGCMAMRPVVNRLEEEAGERLRIIRLDIDKEPGKTLMKKYDVVFTPTFIHFDKDGNKINETIGVLDRARVLYELEAA